MCLKYMRFSEVEFKFSMQSLRGARSKLHVCFHEGHGKGRRFANWVHVANDQHFVKYPLEMFLPSLDVFLSTCTKPHRSAVVYNAFYVRMKGNR